MRFEVKLAFAFITLVALVTLAYASGIKLSPYSYDTIAIDQALEAPSSLHWFGTDALGRDLMIRVIHGACMSLAIAALTALSALIIGVIYGSIAGYVDRLSEPMLRFIDFLYALPDLLVLSLIALLVSRSTSGIVIGMAFINWMDVARLTRTEVARLKNTEFIEASRSIGLNDLTILSKHILPNSLGSIIVALSYTVPRAILAESTLSFIGLGLSPPNTSWGTLAGDAWPYLRTDPHLILFPALMIFLVVFSFNQIGDHLREQSSHKKLGEHLLA
jgi:oligopeptide transport system permease protein